MPRRDVPGQPFGRFSTLTLGLLLIAASLSIPATGQQPEKRVALVIGNSAYPDSPLKNPVNDARAMAAALKGLGFDVIARENVTQKQMQRAIAEFGRRLASIGE